MYYFYYFIFVIIILDELFLKNEYSLQENMFLLEYMVFIKKVKTFLGFRTEVGRNFYVVFVHIIGRKESDFLIIQNVTYVIQETFKPIFISTTSNIYGMRSSNYTP